MPGQFLVANYTYDSDTDGALFWRGYSFKVSRPIAINRLFGGVRPGATGTFAAGIYESGGSNGRVPSALLQSVILHSHGTRRVEIEIPRTELVPDQWYILAEGRVSGEGHFYSVKNNSSGDSEREPWDIVAMEVAEDWLEEWHPKTGWGRWNWQSQGSDTFIVGRTPVDDSNVNARPDIGFGFYFTDEFNAWAKVGGAWKDITSGSVKVGTWKEATDFIPKVGGTWKE